MKRILNFFYALLFFAPLQSLGVPVVGMVTMLTFFSFFVTAPVGVASAVNVEIWKNEIISNLFKSNKFFQYAFNADQYVVGGKAVHIPVSGTTPNVVKNRTELPAAVKIRTDSDIVYLIDTFTTDPILIEHADKVELSYDKRQNVLSDHQMVLNEVCAEWMIYNWFTYTHNSDILTGQIVRTTGAAVASHLATVNDGVAVTGNRKKFLKEDLKSAQTAMNKANIPTENRFALVDSDMLGQLMEDADLKGRDAIHGGELNLKEGTIMKLYGFFIMERSTVLRFTNAGTPVAKDPDAASAAADNAAVLCWQQNSVERAKGSPEFFENEKDPTYYGDIYSALVRVGGRIRRSNGVVAIVQEAA